MYNIKYEEKFNNISVDEVNGVVVNWLSPGLSGNAFLCNIMDSHKNLLTMPRCTLAIGSFVYIYEHMLKDRTLEDGVAELSSFQDEEIRREFEAMFDIYSSSNEYDKPSFNVFTHCMMGLFDAQYKPSKLEWFKALFLAYSMARGRNLNQRIRPFIKVETHAFTTHTCQTGAMYDVFSSFKYFYGISIIRRPSIALASCCDMFRARKDSINYLKELSVRISYLMEKHDPKYCVWTSPCYLSKDDPFLKKRVFIRFEDLKLFPKATLEALREYLDIEWDDAFLDTTANGNRYGQTLRGKGSTVIGYDKTPVYNYHDKVFSKFDHYRFEMIFGDKFTAWGYKPMFYNDGEMNYGKEEILKLCEVKFKFEDFYSAKAKSEDASVRNEFYSLIKRLLSLDYDKESRIPIPWLKPKMEYVDGELYS